MKKTLLILLFSHILLVGISQSLVPDRNFEIDLSRYDTGVINHYLESKETIKTTSIDSTKKSKNKLFVLDSARYRHVIDLRYVYDITLGYNFSYHFLPKRLGVGIRTGMWYKKKDNFPGGIYSRYGIKFSGDLYVDLTLWRAISVQMGVAFQNELTWPSKENPLNDSGKITNWGAIIYLKPTFIFFKHYMISAGVSYSSFQPYKYYEIRPIISIGYKF